MAVRPARSRPTSRCYPHIDPHVTIAVFDLDDRPDPDIIDDLEALATNFAPITTTFGTVNFGKTYLGAAKVHLSPTAELEDLRNRVVGLLGSYNLVDRNKSFPHLSLFYVNDESERTRLATQLVKDNYLTQKPGGEGYVLTACSSRDSLLQMFDGSEIWLVDCRGSVANWQRIGAPIPLDGPVSTFGPTRRN